MRPDFARDMLAGIAEGCAFGLSWVPAGVLQARLSATIDEADAIVRTAEELQADFIFVDARDPWASELVPQLEALGTVAFWSVPGVLGRVAEHSGWVETLRSAVIEPGALAFPLSEAVHSAAEDVRAGVAAGANVFVIADDLASTAGWLVPPDYALDALVPCYQALVTEIAGAGHRALFHSDGDVRALYCALARAGFSGVHIASLERPALDTAVTVARSAGLVPCGGVSAQRLRSEPPGDDVAHLVMLGTSGPILVCDDGGMTTTAEVDRYLRMVTSHRAGGLA